MRSFKHTLFFFALLILSISLTPAAAQTTTFIVWDTWTRQSEQTMIAQLDQQFESAHPGVTIQREAYQADDLVAMLPNVLSQPNAPDVAMIDQHNLATLVSAGLLLPLDDAAAKYNWSSRISADLQAINIVDGKLYGMSASAEMVGMFYNRSLFNQLNLIVPATWDDLEAAFDTIQAHNLIPISLGGSDVSTSVDVFNALAYAYSDIGDIHNLLQRNPGAAFLTEGNLDGAQIFVDWLDAGSFSPNFARMDNNAALMEFENAKSVMWLASTNNSDALIGSMGNNLVGFFPLPSPIGDSVTPTVGGLSLAYGIRATSANADLAAQYIDFIAGSDGTNALLDNGILPASAVDPAKLTTDTLSADLVQTWATLTQASKIAQGFDWVLPNIGAQVQALVSKQIDPEAFVNAVEQDYETGQ